jgi:hypothetical protein
MIGEMNEHFMSYSQINFRNVFVRFERIMKSLLDKVWIGYD